MPPAKLTIPMFSMGYQAEPRVLIGATDTYAEGNCLEPTRFYQPECPNRDYFFDRSPSEEDTSRIYPKHQSGSSVESEPFPGTSTAESYNLMPLQDYGTIQEGRLDIASKTNSTLTQFTQRRDRIEPERAWPFLRPDNRCHSDVRAVDMMHQGAYGLTRPMLTEHSVNQHRAKHSVIAFQWSHTTYGAGQQHDGSHSSDNEESLATQLRPTRRQRRRSRRSNTDSSSQDCSPDVASSNATTISAPPVRHRNTSPVLLSDGTDDITWRRTQDMALKEPLRSQARLLMSEAQRQFESQARMRDGLSFAIVDGHGRAYRVSEGLAYHPTCDTGHIYRHYPRRDCCSICEHSRGIFSSSEGI